MSQFGQRTPGVVGLPGAVPDTSGANAFDEAQQILQQSLVAAGTVAGEQVRTARLSQQEIAIQSQKEQQEARKSSLIAAAAQAEERKKQQQLRQEALHIDIASKRAAQNYRDLVELETGMVRQSLPFLTEKQKNQLAGNLKSKEALKLVTDNLGHTMANAVNTLYGQKVVEAVSNGQPKPSAAETYEQAINDARNRGINLDALSVFAADLSTHLLAGEKREIETQVRQAGRDAIDETESHLKTAMSQFIRGDFDVKTLFEPFDNYAAVQNIGKKAQPARAAEFIMANGIIESALDGNVSPDVIRAQIKTLPQSVQDIIQPEAENIIAKVEGMANSARVDVQVTANRALMTANEKNGSLQAQKGLGGEVTRLAKQNPGNPKAQKLLIDWGSSMQQMALDQNNMTTLRAQKQTGILPKEKINYTDRDLNQLYEEERKFKPMSEAMAPLWENAISRTLPSDGLKELNANFTQQTWDADPGLRTLNRLYRTFPQGTITLIESLNGEPEMARMATAVASIRDWTPEGETAGAWSGLTTLMSNAGTFGLVKQAEEDFEDNDILTKMTASIDVEKGTFRLTGDNMFKAQGLFAYYTAIGKTEDAAWKSAIADIQTRSVKVINPNQRSIFGVGLLAFLPGGATPADVANDDNFLIPLNQVTNHSAIDKGTLQGFENFRKNFRAFIKDGDDDLKLALDLDPAGDPIPESRLLTFDGRFPDANERIHLNKIDGDWTYIYYTENGQVKGVAAWNRVDNNKSTFMVDRLVAPVKRQAPEGAAVFIGDEEMFKRAVLFFNDLIPPSEQSEHSQLRPPPGSDVRTAEEANEKFNSDYTGAIQRIVEDNWLRTTGNIPEPDDEDYPIFLRDINILTRSLGYNFFANQPVNPPPAEGTP